MAPQIGSLYRKRTPERNRHDLHKLVKSGLPRGCSPFATSSRSGGVASPLVITPRHAVPAIEQSWRTRHVDEVPVWVIACFYVRKGHRRQGMTARLISAAVS
jgi:hypothetical protein